MSVVALSRRINQNLNIISNISYLFRDVTSKNILQFSCNSWRNTGLPSVASCIQQKGYATKKSQDESKSGKTPPTKPLHFDYSGELVTQEELDAKETLFMYKDVKELEDAPEPVKKMLSIDFASGRERLQHRKMIVQDNVGKVVGPQMCLEKQIADMTVKIRNLIPYCQAFRKDKAAKSHLIERIQMRKKLLKYMRKLDYERFVWLVTDLQIKYVSPPAYYGYVSARARRKKDVREAALALQKQKLDELKEAMEREKEEFLVYKEKVMTEIEEDIKTYDLNKDTIIQKYMEKSHQPDSNQKS